MGIFKSTNKYQPWYRENQHEEHDQQDNHLDIQIEEEKNPH